MHVLCILAALSHNGLVVCLKGLLLHPSGRGKQCFRVVLLYPQVSPNKQEPSSLMNDFGASSGTSMFGQHLD